jgi:hypothetical protein
MITSTVFFPLPVFSCGQRVFALKGLSIDLCIVVRRSRENAVVNRCANINSARFSRSTKRGKGGRRRKRGRGVDHENAGKDKEEKDRRNGGDAHRARAAESARSQTGRKERREWQREGRETEGN